MAAILGGRVLRKDTTIPIEFGDVVINWGDSECPYRPTSHFRLLNHPDLLGVATNKRKAFGALQAGGVSIPRFATIAENAIWHGCIQTVVRHKLTGHSGEGIEIVAPGEELPSASLYVEYIKKADEYRIHVIGDEVIAVQRKARSRDVPNEKVNWQVRNHANGFVFVRNDVNAPEDCIQAARDAMRALGLDFGGVDVIQGTDKRAYVLEVNTAPGMEGQTINNYAQGFKTLLEKRQ